jgi:hypothetical protein
MIAVKQFMLNFTERLPLTLFVPGIDADHVNPTAAFDDFAIFANSADTCSDFHNVTSLFLTI